MPKLSVNNYLPQKLLKNFIREVKFNRQVVFFNSLKYYLFFILLIFFTISHQNVFGQTTSDTFYTSGSWIVPAGVTQITVEAWGGGSGGSANKGNGGGGGAYAKSTVNVTNNSYPIVVGSGGIGGSTGGNGGNSIFGSSLVVAAGARGITGGNAANCVGHVKWNGGDGGIFGGNSGGGGGGSAFIDANGNTGEIGSGNIGGIGGTGTGNGGNGGDGNNSLGFAGFNPGGGGGGGGNKTNTGANGAAGKVIITWCRPPVLTTHPENQTVTYGNNASFSVSTSATNVSTYQWQENSGSGWINTGTNNSTLTITNPSVLMSGRQYRCIVNVDCGAFATSNTAMLTVNKKELSVSAQSQSVTYGTAANYITQNGTYTISGFIPGENSSVISGTVLFASNYTNTTNAGSTGITISPNIVGLSSANYRFTAISGTITITKANQFINFGSLLSTKPLKDFVNEPVPLDVTSSSGLPVTIALGSGSAATLNYDIGQSPPWFLTDVGETGFVTIILNQAGDNNYTAAPEVVRIFDVTKVNQEIIFPDVSNLSYSNELTVNLLASATSDLNITYQVVSGPATVSGNTLTITGAGNILVKASQGGNASYNAAADVTTEIVVEKGTQTITINVPAETLTSSTQITGISTSGLPVVLTLGSGSAATSLQDQGTYYTLSGIGGSGNIYIVGNQAGNVNFLPASQVIQTIDLSKSNQIISFSPVSNQTYSSTLTVNLTATASSGLTVSFSVTSGPATLSGNTLTITGAGTVVVKANQAGDGSFNPAPSVTQQLEVFKATPVITQENIIKTFGDAPFSIFPTSTSNGSFSFNSSNTQIFTLSGNTATITGAGIANLVISQEQTTNFNGATKTISFQVNNTPSTIIVTGTQNYTYNGLPQGPETAEVTGSLNTATYSYSGTGSTTFGPGHVKPTNVGTYSVTATVAGDENYAGATSAPYFFTINKANPTISITAYSATYDGTSHTAVGTATGVSGESLSGLDLTGTLHTNAGIYNDTWIFTDISGNYIDASATVINTINKKELTITATEQKKCFGDLFVFSGNEFSSAGLVGVETIGNVSFTCTGTGTNAATGNYVITPSAAAGGTFNPDNYQISNIDGLLVVKPLPELTGASQGATVCEGAIATINLSGLIPEKIFSLDFSINGITQNQKTGLYSDASGISSFTTPVLSAENDGQTLQITGITITSETPNCSQPFAQNVTLQVNPLPTLAGAVQQETICEGNSATINLNGLLANTTFTAYYSIDGVDQTSITGIVADGTGNASFTTPLLTSGNNGQILQINGIEITSVSPGCIQSFTQDIILSVAPASSVGIVSSNQTICSNSTPTDLTLSFYIGNIQWQYSTDNSNFTDITGAVSAALSGVQMGVLSETTYYRAKVTSGVCNPAYSNTVTITVNPKPAFSLTGSTLEVCLGDVLTTLTFTVTAGSPDKYSIDFDNVAEAQGFTDITDAPLSGGTIDIAVPATAAPDLYNAVFKGTNSTTGCISADNTFTIIVHSIPKIGGIN